MQAGINIVLKALEAPMRQIAENSGVEGSIVVGKILENKSETFGFDAQTEEYVDMVDKGIIDPAKVVRAALQDAASVAGLLVTTEAMVAEAPKKQSPAPAMPGGGGAAWAAWISDPSDLQTAVNNKGAAQSRALLLLPCLAVARKAGAPVAGYPEQLAHRARRLVDREMGVGVAGGVGIGDGDAAGLLPRPLQHLLVVVAVEQRVRHVAVTVRPAVDGDRRDVARA